MADRPSSHPCADLDRNQDICQMEGGGSGQWKLRAGVQRHRILVLGSESILLSSPPMPSSDLTSDKSTTRVCVPDSLHHSLLALSVSLFPCTDLLPHVYLSHRHTSSVFCFCLFQFLLPSRLQPLPNFPSVSPLPFGQLTRFCWQILHPHSSLEI